jgi:hypothetical protein
LTACGSAAFSALALPLLSSLDLGLGRKMAQAYRHLAARLPAQGARVDAPGACRLLNDMPLSGLVALKPLPPAAP